VLYSILKLFYVVRFPWMFHQVFMKRGHGNGDIYLSDMWRHHQILGNVMGDVGVLGIGDDAI